MLLGIWEGLRVSWVFVVLAIWLNREKIWIAAVLAVSTISVISVGIFSAKDFSRSMTMVLPVAFAGLVLLNKRSPRLVKCLLASVLFALLLPAHHVMDDRIIPVNTVFKELYYIKTVAPTYLQRK